MNEIVPAKKKRPGTILPWFHYSDGGRVSDGYAKEKNDCTVRATAEAFAVTYQTAHSFLARAGRKNGGCLNYRWAVENMKLRELGTCFPLMEFHRKRVYSVLPKLSPQLRYVGRIRGHVFAITGGKIRDNFLFSAGCVITDMWLVKPHAERPGRCLRTGYTLRVIENKQ